MRIKIDSLAHLPLVGLSQSDLFMLKRRLIVIPKADSFNPNPAPIVLYKMNDNFISIPREYFFQNSHQEHELIYNYSEGKPLQSFPPIKLREQQIPVVFDYMRHLREGKSLGGIINVMTGGGKTVMALDISRRLGMTTLIKVYKEDLLLQWKDRINEFLPGAKIGVIQGDRCDYRGNDFVIAMIQTLISRRKDIESNEELTRYFGLEISDEIHRLGSKEWGSIADIFHCKHRLGLSATVRRKDNCEDVFYYHVGKIVTKSEIKVLAPEVYFRDTGFSPRGDRSIDHLPMSTQLKILAGNIYRNKVIVSYVVRAMIANRKVLVLSKFVDHLQRLEQLIKLLMNNMALEHENILNKKVGFYVGALFTGETRQNQKGETIRVKRDLTREELDEARKADCILASYKMAEDAFDQPDIDTLFMALPISDPEQSIGRILRLHNGKQTPVVMDLCDENVSFCSHLKNSRLKFYIRKGWSTKAIKS